ncbi:glycosyltransferase family 4 protein [Leptolyngbya sp. KIOST-1]|uniref:glycosyltransferase family 4 protein n=1 Tax=Leptolyngbya sp. KIOST-1 TaxID=1229172 RepID=UPI000907B35A|nr:glycosyltransferase family 4 protein [Leptolyngbya sp. KIOST-1]
MKIAFISYEYPPDTAFGGIATYVRQAATMLSQRGHQVEVFAGGRATDGPLTTHTTLEGGVMVHRLQGVDRHGFPERVGRVFCDRHRVLEFDVLEGPDCGAEAAVALRYVPDIPLVLKLHTPQYVLEMLGNPLQTWQAKTRMTLGALRRGQWPKRRPPYDPAADPECRHAHEADEIAAPSQAIGQRILTDWKLDPALVASVPYPYLPSPDLLAIPLDTDTQVVTFLGRLELRKGVVELGKAIPAILRRHPQVKFRFVGPAWNSPRPGLNMQQYLERTLPRHRQALEFTGGVPLDRIPHYLATTDICVFPSRWESFGLVCTEAMAAGRGIVASSAGGMAELLDQGRVGRLVPPRRPAPLAQAVIDLLDHPQQRQELGRAARDRVLSHYSLEPIGATQEASYRRAIARRQALGARSVSDRAIGEGGRLNAIAIPNPSPSLQGL